MGPRSVDRGIEDELLTWICFNWLQWGRDQLIAEFISDVAKLRRDALLQWGRDQLIAELTSPLPVRQA